MSIRPDLQPFFDAVADIPSKNWGGCLFFWYCFWRRLKTNGMPTHTFEIVQYSADWNTEPLERNLEWIKGSSNEPPEASEHFSWVYDGVEYEGDGIISGVFDSDDRTILKGLNTQYGNLVEEFCEQALKHGSWNSTFDRSHAIYVVNERLTLNI